MRFLWLLAPLTMSCTPDETPAWAIDTVYVEPSLDGVFGVHTWEIFRAKWDKNRNDRHYLCSVIVELEGTPTELCADCVVSWSVQTTLLESDCDPELVLDPLFLSAAGVGFSAPGSDGPYEGATAVGYVDYGDAGSGTWEVHGWAYPASLDHDGTPSSNTWDGIQGFTLWPQYAWPIQDQP